MSQHGQISRYLEASQAQADGPLLLAFLLNNNNNNPANVPGKNTNPQILNPPISDTVQVIRPLSIVELKQVDALECDHVAYRGSDAVLKRTNASGNHERSLQSRDSSAGGTLTDQQLNHWHRNGYLVIDDALGEDELVELVSCVYKVAEKLSIGTSHDACGLDTTANPKELNPSGKVMANVLPVDAGHSRNPLRRIARLGVGLHRVLPPFRSLVFSRRHQQTAASLGFKDPRVSQCLVVTKPAGVGAAVVPHQDSCSNFQNPTSAVTFWYSLQDSTLENGCLEVASGTHRTEPIVRRTHVDEVGNAKLVDLDRPIFYGDPTVRDYVEPERGADGQFIFQSLPAKAGTLILMHGHLLHRSQPNRSTSDRLACNFSIVEGGTPWPEDAYVRPYPGWTEFEKLHPE